MQTDPYIRLVLTVIASCLVYLCIGVGAESALPVVSAQPQVPPTRVVIVGFERDGRIVPLSPRTGVPVDVVSSGVRALPAE